MGSNVWAYQVDAKKIKEKWESNDDGFIEYFFKKYYEVIDEQIYLFEITESVYKEHISNILKGNTPRTKDSYIYGYIYELLCEEYGEMIEHDDFISYLEDITDNCHLAFIPIPKNRDFPQFYSIYNQDLEVVRNEILNNDEEYLKDSNFINTVNLIFDTALKTNKDVVFFGY